MSISFKQFSYTFHKSAQKPLFYSLPELTAEDLRISSLHKSTHNTGAGAAGVPDFRYVPEAYAAYSVDRYPRLEHSQTQSLSTARSGSLLPVRWINMTVSSVGGSHFSCFTSFLR